MASLLLYLSILSIARGFVSIVYAPSSSGSVRRPTNRFAPSRYSPCQCASQAIADEGVTDAQVISFMRDGHLFARRLIPASLVNTLLPHVEEYISCNKLEALKHKVQVTLGVEDVTQLSVEQCETMLAEVDASYIPFLQLFNAWKSVPSARAIALNAQLGEVASRLLGCRAVRLYQDSLFIKRPGDGATSWHTDLNMAPFDSNDMVTCWIPLQPVPAVADGGSSLLFASGSQRDFALPYWFELEGKDLEERYEVQSYGAFEVGDCSFHHGWTLHSAPGNTGSATRIAYTVTFIRDKARLLNNDDYQLRYPDQEDTGSYAPWLDEVGWGGVAEHPLLPLVFVPHNVV